MDIGQEMKETRGGVETAVEELIYVPSSNNLQVHILYSASQRKLDHYRCSRPDNKRQQHCLQPLENIGIERKIL